MMVVYTHIHICQENVQKQMYRKKNRAVLDKEAVAKN